MKRVVTFLLIFVVFLFYSFDVYADNSIGSSSPKQQKIYISIKTDITIKLNGTKQKFTDAGGRAVYPVIYEGTAYLPVRAMSGLFNKPIEWDSASKTVFIGKTLTDPSGSEYISSMNSSASNQNITGIGTSKPQDAEAYLKPDVLIMYDFVPQSFQDANGNTVYPIIYNGTTYLPVRGISKMMDKSIEWDAVTKLISVNDNTDKEDTETPQENNGTAIDKEVSPAAKSLKSFFEKEELLYYEATSKTTGLKAAATLEEKQQIASKVSEDQLSAQKFTLEITTMDTSQFTPEQLDAYDKTKAFAESTEYYILILENISYLAAQDSDYSMLADTFLYFAMDSQNKMEDARAALKGLN